MGRGSLVGSTKARKSRSSLGVPLSENTNRRASFEISLSPTALARKLEEINENQIEKNDVINVELSGFDTKHSVTTEEYQQHREAVRKLASDPENFDISGRTELNIDGAALAGAKLLIDENRTTRRLSKILKERCGIEEDDILYKPLKYTGKIADITKETLELRKASVIESFVDYKKQLEFKSSVLQYVENDIGKKQSRSEGRLLTRKQKNCQRENSRKRKRGSNWVEKTPKSKEINPLDSNMIIDKYALEVASDIKEFSKKRRRIAPIPFNLDIMDEEL